MNLSKALYIIKFFIIFIVVGCGVESNVNLYKKIPVLIESNNEDFERVVNYLNTMELGENSFYLYYHMKSAKVNFYDIANRKGLYSCDVSSDINCSVLIFLINELDIINTHVYKSQFIDFEFNIVSRNWNYVHVRYYLSRDELVRDKEKFINNGLKYIVNENELQNVKSWIYRFEKNWLLIVE